MAHAQIKRCRLNFSIEAILATDTDKPEAMMTSSSEEGDCAEDALDMTVRQVGSSYPREHNMSGEELQRRQFSWLQCTRYKPPKLCRNKKKETIRKRKLGRNPRVPFTQHQVHILEEKFRGTHYLSSIDVAELSSNLNLTETRVKIWFQNRRARERRDREGTNTPSTSRSCPSTSVIGNTTVNSATAVVTVGERGHNPLLGDLGDPCYAVGVTSQDFTAAAAADASKWSPTSGQATTAAVSSPYALPFFACGPPTTFPPRSVLPFYTGYC